MQRLGELPGHDLGVGDFLVVVEDVLAPARADGDRGVDPQAPAGDVDAVDAVVAQLAGPPVPEPVPVVVEAILHERAVGGGPLPHGIVDARGDRPGLALADRLPLPGGSRRGPSRPCRAPRNGRGPRRPGRAPCSAAGCRLDDPAILPRRLDDPTPLDDVVADRLLDVDVLARLAPHDGDQGMPVVGGRDRDRVDRLVVEQAAEVLLGPGRLARDLLDRLDRLGERLVVDVAERRRPRHPRSRRSCAPGRPRVPGRR